MASWSLAVVAAVSALSFSSCLRGQSSTADASPPPRAETGTAPGTIAPPKASATALQPPPLAPPDAGPPDDAKPGPVDVALKGRLSHLVDAIAHDNPDLATDLLFPRDAFVTAHDGLAPGKDWEKSLNLGYKHRIQALSRRLKGLEHGQVVGVDLGHVAPVTPKRHGWKTPLWSAKKSKLTVESNGKTHTIAVAEMTSWRGSWYITRL